MSAPADGTAFLLVDDNETFLDLLEGIIQRAYPTGRTGRATSGVSALHQLQSGAWDVMLLDYRLPDLDGIEVLAEVKKHSMDTAVVVVTGEGDEQLAADLFRMGAYDYLVKGAMNPAAIRRALDGVLTRRLLEQQISRKSDALVSTSRELAERTRALDVAYEKIREKKVQLEHFSEELEDQVRLRTAELEATTSFLNHILDSTAQHFIVATDPEGMILTFNAGAEALFGHKEDSLVQQASFRSLFRELDDDDEMRALDDELREGGTAQREYTGVDDRGRGFLAKVSFDPLQGGDERTGLVIVGSDVTHERELERQNVAYIDQIEQANQDLRRKNEEILEANRLKSEFLANVSHELRTPLNAIIGYSDLLLGGIYGEMPERQESAVDGVRTRARDLLELINDILDLAKIEAGALDLRVDEFTLGSIVGEVVETGRILALDKPMELSWSDDGASEVVLRTDRQKVQQILVNLVNNAIKFTHQGTIAICTSSPSADQVLIEVVDSGIGIPDDQRDAIFDEFRQVDGTSTRQYEGTGLGLAISRKFAIGLGGELAVSSEVGRGSTFSLRFPTVLPGSGGRITDHLHVPVAIDPTVVGEGF